MSIKALQDYTSYAKYAHYLPTQKRRENWKEQVDRVFDMHERKFSKQLENQQFLDLFTYAKKSVLDTKTLGSQRSLQWGGKGIEKHNAKMYNCAVTAIDRTRAFQEIMYMLLCGCGVGFSVQKPHVDKLPYVQARTKKKRATYTVDDSIEGWGDAIGYLMSSYFTNGVEYPEVQGRIIDFDLTRIRPEGAEITGGFKAPGPEPLRKGLKQISDLIESRIELGENKLRPIDVYDICMYIADAVLSGGVRRSATICMFSVNDAAMRNAKVGNWYYENPQRARSNNSAVLIKGETAREEFDELMDSVRHFGEPGFIWSSSVDILYNPCVEIGMYPFYHHEDGSRESGWQGCNLTEMNGKKAQTEEEFYAMCKASAIIGTMQAAYTHFPYLTPISQKIFEREALLGSSITGMMDSPKILFKPEVQRKGAEIIKKINRIVAELLGINQAARTTCIKPAGTTSLRLGTASGVHPHHARRYIRTVEANKLEWPAQYYAEKNPDAVEDSVWSNSGTDVKISFLCEVPLGSITKNQVSAIDLLEHVKTTQQNWVECGTNHHLCVIPNIRHNVSNTITVKDEEWDSVGDFIFENQMLFAGIALLSEKGDKDYPQAPFATVLTPQELIKEYGDAAMFASGLIVDALHSFDTLWIACDYAQGNLILPTKPGFVVDRQKDWIRRAEQFADRYFEGNVRKMTYCLKDINNWKKWVDLKRTHQPVDWNLVLEPEPFFTDVSTLGATACAGGACEI